MSPEKRVNRARSSFWLGVFFLVVSAACLFGRGWQYYQHRVEVARIRTLAAEQGDTPLGRKFTEDANFRLAYFSIIPWEFIVYFASGLALIFGGVFLRKCEFVDDGPQCRNCRYLLRGLTDARCPECGTPFEPTQ